MAGLLVMAVAGCGDPYAPDTPQAPGGPLGSDAAHRHVGDTGPAPDRPLRTREFWRAGSGLEAFARGYGDVALNWDAGTLAPGLRVLERRSAAPLARELRRTRRGLADDEWLADGQPSSRGHVAAVHASARGARRDLLVVTYELESPGGEAPLEGARYRVYLAAARRTPVDGWRMTRWERQP